MSPRCPRSSDAVQYLLILAAPAQPIIIHLQLQTFVMTHSGRSDVEWVKEVVNPQVMKSKYQLALKRLAPS